MKDFADLKSLGKQLREQAETRAVEQKERVKQEKQRVVEANVFQTALKGVQKMPASDRYVPQAAPKSALPADAPKRKLTQAEDDAQVLRESLSDLFEVDHYLEDDPALNYSAPGVGPDVMKKMRKGHWPIQDELDLHGMNRDQARDALGAFLTRAQQRNHRCVCVIHGRGFGSRGQEPVLKSMVHSWLVQKGVVAFCQARNHEGGEGALIVLLRAALQPQRY
ncbi:DNA mismatch repair protein MutS [Duganella sp. FT80W]|uniref:DNA mismatch repair protein MutS n=1 Tax=Duganella guangzhouensis TaxID=2666084 RepID=A0A6I2L440_9BURK|nr:Smr/MutS family protein [Duganella guangzhouensis]MRW92898.1 DNA mismatch repair protein MutS [Duganella guangzhouensis]